MKVIAGLTPLEKATIAKETAIGVAKELAQIQLPSTFIGGGSGQGGAQSNLFQIMGLKFMNDMMSTPGRKIKEIERQ